MFTHTRNFLTTFDNTSNETKIRELDSFRAPFFFNLKSSTLDRPTLSENGNFHFLKYFLNSCFL